jgi:hypothetical protein
MRQLTIVSIIEDMARGWESKSVESQQESAQTRTAAPSQQEAGKGGNDGAREKQALLLSRAYVLHQIESSTSERYTESLRKALADLDHKLAQLGHS